MNVLAISLSIASLVASGVFCWLGVTYLTLAEGEPIILFVGIYALLYSIASIGILGTAWWRPKAFLRSLSLWAAASVLGLWFVGSLDSWRISGLEAWSILGVMFLLFFNVASVRRVLKVQGAAQQGASVRKGDRFIFVAPNFEIINLSPFFGSPFFGHLFSNTVAVHARLSSIH
jgi:hypothetical protein